MNVQFTYTNVEYVNQEIMKSIIVGLIDSTGMSVKSLQINSVIKRLILSTLLFIPLVSPVACNNLIVNSDNRKIVLYENKTFTNISDIVLISTTADKVIFKNCIFENYDNSGKSCVLINGISVVDFFGCTFRHLKRSDDKDFHAINAYKNYDTLIIRNCIFEDISADGIQLGEGFYTDTTNNKIGYTLISGNKFICYDGVSSENGIDIKASTDTVIISSNLFTGFWGCNGIGCTGDIGTAISIHYRFSKNIAIDGNRFTNNKYAVIANMGSGGTNKSMASPRNLIIQNNFINNGYRSIYIDSVFNVKVVQNTIVNMSNRSIYLEGMWGDTLFANNLMVGGVTRTYSERVYGQNNIQVSNPVDVFFKDYANDDFRLTEKSLVAIDKGINAGATHDIDGEKRYMGIGYDIGADEYPGNTQNSEPKTAPEIKSQDISVHSSISIGSILTTIPLIDSYQGQNPTFTILSGNIDGHYNIDASQGILTLEKIYQGTSDIIHVIIIEVSDSGTNNSSDTAKIIVRVKYDTPTGQSNINKENIKVVSVYPNPCSDYLYIDMQGEIKTDLNIDLIDYNGRVVYTETINSNGINGPIEINLSSGFSGMYYLKVYNSELFFGEKVLVI